VWSARSDNSEILHLDGGDIAETVICCAVVQELTSSDATLGDDGEALRQKVLLERAEQLAQIGSWQWDCGSGELWWSDNLFRLMGLRPGQITPTTDHVVEQTHPDDRDRVVRYVEQLRDEGRLPPLQYRILWPDGTVRHLRSTVAPLDETARWSRMIIGAVQDVTDQCRADREIAAHLAVAETLTSDWHSLEQCGTHLLRGLALAMDCVAGALWVPRRDVLVASVFWRGDSGELSEFEALTRETFFPKGCDVPGRAWAQRRPVSIVSPCDDPSFARRASAARDRIGGVIALPALAGEEVLAVIELHSSEATKLTERLLRTLTGIGHEIGQFLATRRSDLSPPLITDRESQVLVLLSKGATNAEIAQQLVLAQSTVSSHVKHILRKLGARNRTEAVARYLSG
jgi:PAS domain S-box-containing protein